MRFFYKAGNVRMMTFDGINGKKTIYLLNTTHKTRFTKTQLKKAEAVGTIGTKYPWTVAFSARWETAVLSPDYRCELDWVNTLFWNVVR